MPDKVQMLGEKAVWIKFISDKDLEEFLDKADFEHDSSTFSMLMRWMECMGSPPSPVRLKFRGYSFMFGMKKSSGS